MRLTKRFLIGSLVSAALFWLYYDFSALPAWNFTSFGFWLRLGFMIASFAVPIGLLRDSRRAVAGSVLASLSPIVLAIVLSVGSWGCFPGNAARYAAMLPIEERAAASFVADFRAEVGAEGTQVGSHRFILPIIDKVLSVKVAQGSLGQYGAQFSMNEEIFTAVTVNRGGQTEVVRVSPLDYSGSFVALSAGAAGTVGYLEVNQATGAARLVSVAGGMKYTPGAVFGYDLLRHVRYAYRTALLGDFSFEIDDNGQPYWLVPVLRRTVGLFGGDQLAAIILVDPVSGQMERYAPGLEPAWVDRTVPTSVMLPQANNALTLVNGWFNAVFGAKQGVLQLSDGYNYAFSEGSDGGQTWFVSGITSPNEADQTQVAVLLVNMKTRQALRYPLGGITEMRAMEIAESDERVRAQMLTATWPILTDVGGQPAFFLFLKNEVQLQRFVYIDLATGNRVAMGQTIEAARFEFARLVGAASGSSQPESSLSGLVKRVSRAGDDLWFLLSGDPVTLYSVAAGLGNGSRFLEPGDEVSLNYRESSATPGQRFVTRLRNRSIGE